MTEAIIELEEYGYRQATAEDIVCGNIVYLIGDYDKLYKKTIEEVLYPSDEYKAFVADDGCRYGLDGLFVRERQ